MKLWGGRFTKETDQLVQNFNESLSFDQKFYRQDIRGSIAHVKMLAKQGILSEKDRDDIIKGLEGIRQDLDEGTLIIPAGSGYEDIHSFVEGTLTERIGEAGKRLHTGRSRNDHHFNVYLAALFAKAAKKHICPFCYTNYNIQGVT